VPSNARVPDEAMGALTSPGTVPKVNARFFRDAAAQWRALADAGDAVAQVGNGNTRTQTAHEQQVARALKE